MAYVPMDGIPANHMKRFGRERSSVLELAILFLPAIPALLWLWPNIRDETTFYIVQSAAYVYVFCGVVFIGLRRWSWDKLGVNRRGFWLGLSSGGVLILLRILAQWSFGLPIEFVPLQLLPLFGNAVFYFCLVALVEELLFRGLLFRALEDWRGPLFAVIGSSIGFALWHIGWAGPLIIGHFLIGLFFGLIRLRSGSITPLIIIHGADDLLGVLTANPISADRILPAIINHQWNYPYIILGDFLFFSVIIFLVFLYPRIRRKRYSPLDPDTRGL